MPAPSMPFDGNVATSHPRPIHPNGRDQISSGVGDRYVHGLTNFLTFCSGAAITRLASASVITSFPQKNLENKAGGDM